MLKKLGIMIVVGCAVLGISVGTALAGEMDLLVQKLVDKGILTAGEAQELVTQTKEEVKAQNAKGTNEMIPSWIQTTKIKGDFRLREEWTNSKQDPNSTSSANENRTRIRMRLGIEAKPNDQTKVAVGIATGYTDPRSTNVTLGQGTDNNSPDTFKYLSLDYAYGQYTPFAGMTLSGGKIKNPFWQPNDLIWDTDVNMDAVAMQWQQNLFSGFDVYMNNALSIMGDARTAKQSEPYMLGLQPGFKLNLTDNVNLNAAAAYYQFTSVKDRPVFTKWATNSKRGVTTLGAITGYDLSSNPIRAASTTTNYYIYNYNTINPSAELTFKNLFGDSFLPYLAVFGDFVYNVSAPKSVTGRGGYDYGIKFGNTDKIGDKGQWQAKFSYDKLGRDAFLDIFPDSDRYSGKTNIQSYEGILEYGLGKNTSIALDYYWAQSLTRGTSGATNGNFGPEQTLQLDWNLKF